MGRVIRDFDWATTSLAAIEHWPSCLKITLGNMLRSAFPMFLFWGDDLLCFYNDAFKPSMGTEGKHPAIGKKGKEVWADVWDFTGPLMNEVMTTGKAVYFEDKLVPFYRNGSVDNVYWTFSYSPVTDEEGCICGVLVTCIETTTAVTARKQIEGLVISRTAELEKAREDLLTSNAYLQQIINLFKEPLQVLEPVFDGEIVDFCFKITNEVYSAYANAKPEQLINKKVSEVFPGYLNTTSFTKVAEAFRTGISDTWEIHYNVDGLDLHNQMSASRLGNEVVVHFTDFTRLKNLQLQLEGKIEELERSNQNLEEFAHAASHDLKEPIRKISIFTSQLKNELKNQLQEKQLFSFERIENASKRMELLVDDLLLYSHVSQHSLEKESVNLNLKLQLVLEDLELDIKEKEAVVYVGQLPTVQGYRRQLQQMFQNLVSNALKYRKPGEAPHITIQASTATDNGQPYHLIEVADNGIGFEQKYVERIFKMFTRLHGKNEYAGSGVGLSIVRKVIENHHGIIRAEGVPGVGSTFKVYLPF